MNKESNHHSATLTLIASITLTGVLGSIHAFSVFLQALENNLNSGRAEVSLIYSGALICLTISVLFGHRIYARFPPATLALLACLAAAAGITLAGFSHNYWLTVFGYSIIFGGANGVGYGFALQISAQAMPSRQGFAMGIVTAFYAFGATVAPFIFNYLLTHTGLAGAMSSAGFIFCLAGCIAALLLKASKMHFSIEEKTVQKKSDKKKSDEKNTATENPPENKATQYLLWLGYGSGALAGLMVLGHATGIVQAAGGGIALAVGGAIVIAFGNMLGGLAAGMLADRVRISALLIFLPLASAVALTLSANIDNATLLLCGLVIVGFTYGAIIAVYPVAVISIFGASASSRIYGRVFTSWGVAGLLGPWLAGIFYDTTGAYKMAIFSAAVSSALSVCVAYYLSRQITLSNQQEI